MPLPYDWTAVFTDMGQVVRAANRGKVAAGNLDDDKQAQVPVFVDDDADADFLALLLQQTEAGASTCRAVWSAIANQGTAYARSIMRTKLDIAQADLATVLNELELRMDNETPAQTVDANEVTMYQLPYVEAGDNNTQVSGYELIRGMTVANVELVGTDYLLYVSVIDDGGGFFHIELFNAVARGGGDLIAHTATYNTVGDKPLTEDNASDIAGNVTVDAVTAADADITVTFQGDATGTGNGLLTLWAATQMAQADVVRVECVSVAAGAGAEVWQVTSQRIGLLSDLVTTGVAYPSATQTDRLGIAFTIAAGGVAFVVGDYYEVAVAATESGVFQTFWRDHFSKALPSVNDGAETISDALAEP